VKEPELLMASDFIFKGMIRKRLSAEQFSDAVSSSLVPLFGDSMVVYNVLPTTVKGNLPFTRASMIRNNPFLLALGRPNRETVTTSRTSQANLIQALELTNGYTFNEGMKRAAQKWTSTHTNPDQLVTALYRNMLGRKPNTDEKAIALKALGAKPDTAQVQDLIWAMTVHPEFQLIY
jgi:hypothetical protein